MKKIVKRMFLFLLIIVMFSLVSCSPVFNTNDQKPPVEENQQKPTEEEKKYYDVTFETNGGGVIDPIIIESGESIDLPTPSKKGHTFIGWFTGESVNDGQFTSVNVVKENLILYAKWEQFKYTLFFETNGGSELEKITYFYNEEIFDLPLSYKEGYGFEGWYLDEELNTIFDYTVFPDHSLILYAKWVDAYTLLKRHMIEYGTRIDPPVYNTMGYYVVFGDDISDVKTRKRNSLRCEITFSDFDVVRLFGKYVFSDNTELSLGIEFEYGNMTKPTRITYFSYDPKYYEILGNGRDISATYGANGWNISLFPVLSGLPGNINYHNEDAELLGNIIVLKVEEYLESHGIPMFK